jgi:predicted Zn-dependent peptidase
MSPSDSTVLRRTVLPGGLRVVTEAIPGVRSAAFGVWVGVGSRDESPALAGTSHYLEHLLFKGTPRRDALEIASAIEAVGGESNAFTDKEYTCFYARVLDTDLPLAIDVTCDMVTSSLLRAKDVESERAVVLEEIAMRDDDPGDLVHELFAEALYGEHPLGRPIIGSVASIEGLSRRAIHGFYRRRYVPSATVIAAAGHVDHDEVVDRVAAAYGERLAGDPTPAPLRPSRGGPAGGAAVARVERRTEQANLVVGTTALARHDPRRLALAVLSGALGGGQASRLFQSIREERGLAYSVYSYVSSAADTGQFGVYVGCAPKKVDEVLRLVRDGLDEVAAHGLRDEEVARAKGQLRGETVLGLEDTGSRMSRIGKAELMTGELLTVDELLTRIDAVTPEQVREVAAEVLSRPRALGVVGPFRRDFANAV